VLAFPLPAGVRYDYASLFGPKHQGCDVFAARGTPVLAVDNGHARATEDPRGGHVVYLAGETGYHYYYAHLESRTPELEAAGDAGVNVRAGEQLGTVGTSGNAAGKQPHLHFQVATPNAATVDPFPFLAEVDPKLSEPLPAQPEIPEPPPDVTAPSSAPSSSTATAAAAGGGGLVLLALLWFFGRRRRR
jgi:MYXO-CTERM domain-containing protein